MAERSRGKILKKPTGGKRGAKRRRRAALPLVRSKRPGTVVLDNAKIFEIIPFP